MPWGEWVFWCALGVALLAYLGPAIISTPLRDGNPIVLIGLAVGIYFIGSFCHSLLSGNREIGSSTTAFSCGKCGHAFNWFHDIVANTGQTVTCPRCGTRNRV